MLDAVGICQCGMFTEYHGHKNQGHTLTNLPSLQQHAGFDAHMTGPQPLRMGGCADIDNC